MKQIIIVISLLAILGSCNNTSKKEKPNTLEKTKFNFEKYISTLEQIPLPLKHNPLGHFPKLSKNFDKNGFNRYKHIYTSQPLGIYYKNEKSVGIIDCSVGDWGLVPFLTIYDLKGNKIDSTGFYNKSAMDMGYKAIEYLTFNNDQTITVLDTIRSWKMDEDELNMVEGSLKMTTGKTEYQILENGKIQKLEAPVEKEFLKKIKDKTISECSHPEYFDFKHYKEYCVTDTISIDLNGNGISEKIYFDQKDCPKLIIEEKGKDLISIGCGKEEYKGFPNAMGWVNLWCIVSDKESFEIIVEDGELVGDKTIKLERPSIYVGKEEAGGGIITYRNGKLYWIHQSD